jgi:hypothetical protein
MARGTRTTGGDRKPGDDGVTVTPLDATKDAWTVTPLPATARLAGRKRYPSASPGERRTGAYPKLERTELSADLPAVSGHDGDFATSLTLGFADAVREAVAKAHAAGLAVSGQEDGVAVELLPDGTRRVIDESCEWSPTGWRDR